MSTEIPINRLGFTEIPRQDVGSGPDVVMIFVHGLQGNPQTTWSKSVPSAKTSQNFAHEPKSRWFRRYRGSKTQKEDQLNASGSTSALPSSQAPSSSTEFCWPKDDLPKKLPNVQILLYGYEADIIGAFQPSSQNTITTHGKNFLIALERKLPKNVPLIFVAHSLGGILVKDVLSMSKSHHQHKYKSIHSNTCRVVFMGTPHQGSDVAGLGIVLANITKVVLQNPNKDLLRGLYRGGEVLDRINTSFSQLLIKPDFGIHCFQEDRGVTWVPGLTSLVVDYQSSKTGSPHETCETVAANHMDMVAYSSPEDDNYRQVSEALVSFVEEIIKTSPSVARQPHMDTNTPTDTNASKFLAALSSLTPGLTLGLPRLPLPDAVDGIDMGALEWFFDSPELDQWVRESGLLWLSGGPASGKTTVSFCLWDKLKQNETFATKEDIAVFFFSNLEHTKNQVAQILTAIIYQLLHSNRERLEFVIQNYPVGSLAFQTSLVSPSPSLLDYLWKILFVSITAVPTCPTTLIIDGFDELRTEVERRAFCNNLLRLQTEIATKGTRGFKTFITARPYNDIKKALTGVLTIEKDKERQQCLQVLRFDELNARRDRVEHAHESTGEWLKDDAGYNLWNSNHSSGLLLIRGKPGSGKSTLAKFILNLLKSQHGFTQDETDKIAEAKNTVLIADFFYSFRGGKTETSHMLMVQSLLHQLLSQDERLFPLFRETFRARQSDGHPLAWEWKDLRRVFASLGSFKACEKIYILLDAMDESDEQGRPEILQIMKQLCSSTAGCAIKALIATRPLPPGEIDERLSYCYPIVLHEKNQKDIENVIFSGIREIKDVPGSPSFDLGFVEDFMMQNADGVFLWVALVFRELKVIVSEGCSRGELEVCVNTLPTELEDMYGLIIRRLFDQPEHRSQRLEKEEIKKKRGIKMLNWVTFATRPLTVKEFRDAITIPSISEPFNPDRDYLNQNRIDGIENRIRTCCGSLVEIRRRDVQLLHQTARDFLLRKDKAAAPFDIDLRGGDTEISSVSIRYLRLLSLRTGSKSIENWNQTDFDAFVKWLSDYPLLTYIIPNLSNHMRLLAAGSPVFKEFSLLAQNLRKDEVLRHLFTYWAVMWYRLREEQGASKMQSEQFRTKTLIAAARGGYEGVVTLLVLLETDINAYDEASGVFALLAAAENGHLQTVQRIVGWPSVHVNARGGPGHECTALHAASANGHEEMVMLLIERGADINAQGGEHGDALQAASANGHQETVKLLIERGADINAYGGEHGKALQAASAGGYENVVKQLLNAGAHVNAPDGMYGTALQAASVGGYEDVVKQLLVAGAHVNARGGTYGTALQAASVGGYERVVKQLLVAGADFNAPGGTYGTALQAASVGGYERVVKQLLVAGADFNAPGGTYGTALQAASVGGYERVVKQLLVAGADFNAPGGKYGNALQAASAGGYENVVKQLLNAGAHVNAPDGMYGTALQAASVGGYERVVKQLLVAGAHVNAEGGMYGTALQAASVGGYERVVKQLLVAGAHVNAEGGMYGTALQAASVGGYENVVKQLLVAGADFNAPGGKYGNALQAASAGGYEDVVKQLLNAGAYVNAPGGQYGNALQAASAGGYERVVRRLLDAGAHVNAQGGNNGTALQAALANGHKQVVELLIERGAQVNPQDSQSLNDFLAKTELAKQD